MLSKFSRFSRFVKLGAQLSKRYTYYPLARFATNPPNMDPKPPRQDEQTPFDKLEEGEKNPDYMELIGFDRPADIHPEAPGIFTQQFEANLPTEFRIICLTNQNAVTKCVGSKGTHKLPPQFIKDVMNAFTTMSEDSKKRMFPKLIGDLNKEIVLDGKKLLAKIKDLMGYNWWYHGEVSNVLKGMGFSPSLWEASIADLNQKDPTFAHTYVDFQRKIVENIFKIADLDEATKREVNNFLDKEFVELSKNSMQYEGLGAKVDHLLKDKLHLDIGSAAEKVVGAAKKVIGKK